MRLLDSGYLTIAKRIKHHTTSYLFNGCSVVYFYKKEVTNDMKKYSFQKAAENPIKYTREFLLIPKDDVICFYRETGFHLNEITFSNILKIIKRLFPELILPRNERNDIDSSLLICVLFRYMWETHLETCMRLISYNEDWITENSIIHEYETLVTKYHYNANANSLFIRTILNPIMKYQMYISANTFDVNDEDYWMYESDSIPYMKFNYLFSLIFHFMKSDKCKETLLNGIIPLQDTMQEINTIFEIVNKLKEE